MPDLRRRGRRRGTTCETRGVHNSSNSSPDRWARNPERKGSARGAAKAWTDARANMAANKEFYGKHEGVASTRDRCPVDSDDFVGFSKKCQEGKKARRRSSLFVVSLGPAIVLVINHTLDRCPAISSIVGFREKCRHLTERSRTRTMDSSTLVINHTNRPPHPPWRLNLNPRSRTSPPSHLF